jgi:hypothetical protein
LAQKHGLSTSGLEFGAACALMYSVLSIDENNAEAKKIKELYEEKQSIEDVLTYTEIYNKTKYYGLDISKDTELIKRIHASFNNLKKQLNDLQTKEVSGTQFSLTVDEAFQTRRFK